MNPRIHLADDDTRSPATLTMPPDYAGQSWIADAFAPGTFTWREDRQHVEFPRSLVTPVTECLWREYRAIDITNGPLAPSTRTVTRPSGRRSAIPRGSETVIVLDGSGHPIGTEELNA